MSCLLQIGLFLRLAVAAMATLLGRNGYAQDATANYVDIQIEESEKPFESALLSDAGLMAGGLAIKEVGGATYVFAVGVASNKALQGQDPQLVLDTMKVAQLKAKAEVSRFIRSEIRVDRTVQSTQEASEAGGMGNMPLERQRQIRENISERAQNGFRGLRRLGSWYSADRRCYCEAIIVPADGK